MGHWFNGRLLRVDDRLDALAIAVGYWVEQMSLIQEEREQEARADRLMAEVRKTHEAMALGLAVMLGDKPTTNPNDGAWVKNKR